MGLGKNITASLRLCAGKTGYKQQTKSNGQYSKGNIGIGHFDIKTTNCYQDMNL
jgi:hypothetical protein